LMVFFLLLFPAVNGLRQKIGDFDLWWHLVYGKWIVEHGAVPWRDFLSYTAHGNEWLAYSWLAEVLFHLLASGIGFDALIYLQTALAVGVVGFLYLGCRATGARRTVAVATAALAGLGTSFAWAIRPVQLTLLLLAVLVWALRSERMERRLAWLAPLVVALWANVHILFVWGIALVGFAALCRTLEGRPAANLWAAAGLATLASAANPFGPYIFVEVARMAEQPLIAPEVTEFQSPNFQGPHALAMGAFLFPALVVLALARRRPTLFELGTFLGSLALGLALQRNMALFAILGAPTIARAVEDMLPREAPARPRAPGTALLALHYALLAWGVAYAASWAPPRSPRWIDHVEPGVFPVGAVDHLAAHPPPRGRVFNDFDWGGFVLYRLFPRVRVSVDGRTPVYGEEVLRPYMRTHFLEPGWEEFIESSDPDVVLWPAKGSLANLLRELPEWSVEFEDETAVVLRRRP
ncbi:MAG: hypothetical protein ACREQ9_16125, partial [Candidatus Binatia bacterium]